MIIMLVISLFLTASDQIIKLIVDKKVILNGSIEIIPNFFNITHVHNYGAAWSILTNKSVFLIFIAIISLVIIYFYFIKDKSLKKIDIIFLSMLISGIIGNMIDRVRFGYVVDYLDFNLFGYDFPVFNLADTLIVLAVIILIIKTLMEGRDGKNNSFRKWRKYSNW